VRSDLTVHEPLEQPDRAINGVACRPPRLKIEAFLDTLDHRVGDGNLGYRIGARALAVDNNPGFVVDQIIDVISKKGSVFFLATHAACGSISETAFGGLPAVVPPLEADRDVC
jgi:hypothetical protein